MEGTQISRIAWIYSFGSWRDTINIMIRHLAILVFLIGAYFSLPHQSSTCEPQPDNWFTEIYSIGSMLLPEHVTIELSPKDSAKGYLSIYNNSETALYVLPQEARSIVMVSQEPALGEGELAEENTPKEILLIDLVSSLAAFTVTSSAHLHLDMDNFTTLVPYIEERNIVDYGRPSFVYLPIAQRGEFHLVYGEQIFTVQFAISYALNDNFSPVVCGEELAPAVQQEDTFTDEANNSILIGAVAVSIIFMVSLGALLWVRKLTTDE